MFRRFKRFLYSLRQEPLALRRWEAAKTTRLNDAHWRDSGEEHVNSDLQLDLETLRQRILLELENNPFMEGVVETFVGDLVGEEGPQLEVISEDDDFNSRLEAAWTEWWDRPDVNEQQSGVEVLDLAVRQLWTQGSFLWQKLTARKTREFGVRLRLNEIHPRRLSTPPNRSGDFRVALGVERTKTGKPIAYHIRDALPGELSAIGGFSIKTTRVLAQNMIHAFRRLEAGQVDGVPWLAPSLQTAADLRDYDAQVLDAARAAADHMVLLHSEHEDAPFFEVNESTEYQRRQIRTLPPGWRATQMRGEQPTTTYIDYRTERHREIGRPACMPVQIVRLDSSRHNFASARFDAKPYQRRLRKIGAWTSRSALNRLVKLVELESGLRARRPAGGYRLQWTWPIPRFSGDPSRDAKADDLRLKNLSTTLREVVQEGGKTWETHMQQLRREITELTDAGVIHPAMIESLNRAGQAASEGDRNAVEEIVREMVDEIVAERNQSVFAASEN